METIMTTTKTNAVTAYELTDEVLEGMAGGARLCVRASCGDARRDIVKHWRRRPLLLRSR